MLIQSSETYVINGAAFEVYNQLGNGFLEAVYQEAIEREFIARSIPYEREKELTIYYKGEALKHTYRPDFVCYGNIIVELKAVFELDNLHRAQLYNYLKVTGYKLGLLYNFGHADGLQYERIVK